MSFLIDYYCFGGFNEKRKRTKEEKNRLEADV